MGRFFTEAKLRYRQGGILFMTAGLAAVLLAMTALVTDVGYMYYSHAKLQTAVNAAWKAGYDKLVELQGTDRVLDQKKKDLIIAQVKEVMNVNGFSEEDLQLLNVEFGEEGRFVVRSQRSVGLFFARVMNVDSAGVAASRGDLGVTSMKVVPLGIPHGVVKDVSKNVYNWCKFTGDKEFTANQEYILKLGEGEVIQSGDIMPFGLEVRPGGGDFFGYQIGLEYSIKGSPGDPTFDMPPTGNFGALALGGRGANDYGDIILNGYDDPLNLGDWVDSEPGNMAGDTIDNVEERIRRGQTNVQIPVVSDFGDGRKPVQIMGFLNFTLVGTGIEGQGANAKASVRAVFNGITDTDLGKPKHTYGIIDPDNVRGGSEIDYIERFKLGYNGVVNINDRLIPEAENLPEATDEAVNFRLNGSDQYRPNTRVIIPITDIGPEVAANNVENANAETIYDLQGLENPNGAYKTSEYNFGSSVRVTGFAEFEILHPDNYSRAGSDYEDCDSGDLGPYQPGQVRGKFIRYVVKPGEVPIQ